MNYVTKCIYCPSLLKVGDMGGNSSPSSPHHSYVYAKIALLFSLSIYSQVWRTGFLGRTTMCLDFWHICYLILCLCTAIITDITENMVRPLLLSAVSPPTDNFTASVDVAMSDIKAALNGYNVGLKNTLSNYVRAVAAHRLDEVLSSIDLGFGFKVNIVLTKKQKECAIQFGFNHVYNNTDAAAELVSLLQNISTAVGVIKQVMIQRLYY